jgi:hypothetical protein
MALSGVIEKEHRITSKLICSSRFKLQCTALLSSKCLLAILSRVLYQELQLDAVRIASRSRQ